MRSFLLIAVVLFLSTSVAAIPAILSDQGTDATLNGTTISDADLTITIHDAASGGSTLFTETFTSAIQNGSWNVNLNESLLNFLEYNRKYWKDYSIDGTDLDFNGDERLAFYSPLGLITNQSTVNTTSIGGWSTNGTATSTNQIARVNNETSTLFIVNTSSGNVGIHTDNPRTPLDIRGTTDQYSFQVPTTGTAQYVRSNAGIDDFAGYNLGLITLAGTYDDYTTVGTGAIFGAINAEPWNATSTPADMTFRVVPSGSTAVTERMRITSEGNIGINTTEPNSTLHVIGDANISGSMYVGGGEVCTNSNGLCDSGNNGGWTNNSQNTTTTLNVGIGTTTPITALTINGALSSQQTAQTYGGLDIWADKGGYSGINFFAKNGTYQNSFLSNALGISGFYQDGGAGWLWQSSPSAFDIEQGNLIVSAGYARVVESSKSLYLRGDLAGNPGIQVVSADPLVFWTTNTERMRLTADGNLGIGTTTPGGKLSVTNTGTDTSFIVEDSASTDSTPFIIDASGNVGVGTAAPNAKLEVTSGQILAPLGSALLPGYAFSGDADTGFSSFGNDLRVSIGGTGLVRFTGGSAPSWQFASTADLLWSDGVVGSGSDVGLVRNAAGVLQVSDGKPTPGFGTLIAGNVGIGTTNPNSTLQLNGGTGSLATGLSFGDGDTGIYESIDDTMAIAINDALRATITNANGGTLYMGSGSTGGAVNGLVSNVATPTLLPRANDDDTGIGRGGANVLSFITGGAGRMIIDDAGNVGINTTQPNSSLHVIGTANITGAAYVNGGQVCTDSNGLCSQSLSTAGGWTNNSQNTTTTLNVGIGTTTPSYELEVLVDSNDRVALGDMSGVAPNEAISPQSGIGISRITDGALTGLMFSEGANAEDLGIKSRRDIHFYNNQERSITIAAGNLGINTTDPNSSLEIVTRNSAGALHIQNGTTSTLFVNTSNGRVGIGTSTPNSDFHIEGSTLFGGSLGGLRIRGLGSSVQITGINTDQNSYNDIQISQGASNNLIVFDTAGKVGINTSDPNSSLHVIGDANITGNMYVGGGQVCTESNGLCGGSGSASGWTNSSSQTNTSLNVNIYNASNSSQSFFYVNQSSGYVGIGTNTPSQALHVIGTANITGAAYVNGGQVCTDANSLCPGGNVTASGGWTNTTTITSTTLNVGIGTSDPIGNLMISDVSNASIRIDNTDGGVVDDQIVGRIDFATNDATPGGTGVQTYIQTVSSNSNGLPYRLEFGTGSSASPTSRLTITEVGTVGIGTTDPNKVLHVVGTANITGSSQIGEYLYVDQSTGNSGFNTTSPARTLHVNAVMRLEPISSAPSSAGAGDIYFDSDLNKPCYYNSTDWVTFDGNATCS